MLNNRQYLLTKLAEECCEVGVEALKNQHFGMDEKQFSDGPTNKERLHKEINDILGIIAMLNEEEGFDFTPDLVQIEAKKNKVSHYREYSRNIGQVEEISNE